METWKGKSKNNKIITYYNFNTIAKLLGKKYFPSYKDILQFISPRELILDVFRPETEIFL